jgi:serine/threonine protein kinase
MKKTDIKDVVKEAKILRKVEHKYIIRSYAHFIEDDALNIIMEFAERGDLQKVFFLFLKGVDGQRS